MKKILLFSLLVLFSCDLKKDTLPNVIVILVDDLGYADLGFTGSNEISTPNIDGLAETVLYLQMDMFPMLFAHQVEQG